MSEMFDTSKIRDDAEYWDELAARVANGAISAERPPAGVLRFAASSSSWIAATALASAAALIVFVLQNTASQETSLAHSLQPADLIGRNILEATQPPSVGALLLEGTEGGNR